MPDSVWTAEIRVHPYETDINNRWKPTAIFQAFQEAANAHASSLGFDYHSLLAKGHIWVLSRLKVYFYRFPAMGDQLQHSHLAQRHPSENILHPRLSNDRTRRHALSGCHLRLAADRPRPPSHAIALLAGGQPARESRA